MFTRRARLLYRANAMYIQCKLCKWAALGWFATRAMFTCYHKAHAYTGSKGLFRALASNRKHTRYDNPSD